MSVPYKLGVTRFVEFLIALVVGALIGVLGVTYDQQTNESEPAHSTEIAYKNSIVILQEQNKELKGFIGVASAYDTDTQTAMQVYDCAQQNNIEFGLGMNLVRVESGFDPNAVSSAGALGLAQVMLPTAREIEPEITREELLEPRTNLCIGFHYLRQLIDRYDGNTWLALAAYNAGPARVDRASSTGEYDGSNYANKVTRDG